MENGAERFRALLAEGAGFTYDNSSEKSPRGYPESLLPDWLSWLGRAQMAVDSAFGTESPMASMLRAGLEVAVLGNGPDKFNIARAQILGALRTSVDAIEQGFSAKAPKLAAPDLASGRVFVVHGHDDALKTELEVFLKNIGLDPIVLHRQPDQGATILEKFERHADVGYAFILLTPDDVAYSLSEAGRSEAERKTEMRARQNVIFEFGFFVGRLRRSRVCCLYTEGVTLPSDLDGLVYKRIDDGVESIGYALIKELRAAGYSITV